MYSIIIVNRQVLYTNIGLEVCVQGCDIARACEGYITSLDTNQRPIITGHVSILYTIHIIIII